MENYAVLNTGMKAGISSSLWKRHKLTGAHPYKISDEDDTREESEEFLNWTAQMLTHTLDQTPYKWDNFSADQIIEINKFLPDHLIDLVCSRKPYLLLSGYVLFADVSGFTPLCEKYASFGLSGAYRLTATLNSYIGKMVGLIYSHGGDLIKFAGDAFLAVWECQEINFRMHKVVTCAMEIQNSLGHFETEVGIFLTVKLSLSVGTFIFTTIGTKQNATYIIYGAPILEVKAGEKLCSSGDTVLSPAAWSLLDPFNYVYEVVKGGFVKVREILYEPTRHRQFNTTTEKKNTFSFFFKPWKSRCETYIEVVDEEVKRRNSVLRPIILMPELKRRANILKRFIIAPVVNQVQKGSSVEYLIEMRQVTIMFVNIVPNVMTATKIILLVHEAYQTITTIVENKLGVINKACLFDKDIMFLVLFGLKGYKGKDEALRTLQSGALVIDKISNFANVKSVSVGITVGTTYCGVVGHPQRKEYSVIGRAVNRAARLMCTFKNVVSCDYAVVFNSRLPSGYFQRSEPVFLKGMGAVGNIFIYLGVDQSSHKMPLLGHQNTVCKFLDMLTKKSPYQCLILRGDPRVGKTRIVKEFQDIAEKWDWNSLMISVNQMATSGICLIHKLISSFLGKTIDDRIKALLHAVPVEDYDHLHLLNEILDVNFSVPYNYGHEPCMEDEESIIIRILRKVLHNSVFIIDDAEDLDFLSWKTLCTMITIPDIVVVFAVQNSFDAHSVYSKKLIYSPLSLTVDVECLPLKYIAPLVCQMLPAHAVLFKLIRVLKKISHGNPGWIQTFLLSYVDSGSVIVTPESSNKLSRKEYIIPDISLLNSQESYSPTMRKVKEHLQVVHFIATKDEENEVPPTFDDVIMATFDQLTPFEQLLLKCGSILGKEFKRHALVCMIGRPSASDVCKAIENLFRMDILGCANVKRKRQSSKEFSPYLFPLPECNCDSITQTSTIYQMIPINQRIQFHTRALSSIKQQFMKCNECRYLEFLKIIEKKMESHRSKRHRSTSMDMTNIKIVLEQLQRSVPSKDFTKTRSISSRRPAIIGVERDSMIDNKTGLTGQYTANTEGKFEVELNTLKEMAEKRQNTMFITLRKPTDSNLIKTNNENAMENSAHFEEEHDEGEEDTFQMYVGDVLDIVRDKDDHKFKKVKKKKKFLDQYEFFKPEIVNCHCYDVGIDVYHQLIHHSQAAELKITELKYLVECALHHCKYSNFQNAIKLLQEARKLYSTCVDLLLESDTGTKLAEENDSMTLKELEFEKKKIHCYLGKCYLYVGNFEKSLQELKEIAPSSNLSRLFLYILRPFMSYKKKYAKKRIAEIKLTSSLYSNLSELHLMTFSFYKSVAVAKSAISYAQSTHKLYYIANAYAAYLDASLLIGELKQSKKKEKEALNFILSIYTKKSNLELISIGKVLLCIFKGRVHRGELEKAVEVGQAVINISESFKALDALSYVYPLMIMVLGYLGKFEKIKQLFIKLHEQTDSDQYECGIREHLQIKTNLYILLELGCCMMPPNKLINKITRIVDPRMIHGDKVSWRIIGIHMWVWYLRRKDFQNAKLWEFEKIDNVDLVYENVSSTLLLLQGMLMNTAHILGSGKSIDEFTFEHIRVRVKNLEWICKNRLQFLLPRFYHLKAYKQILWSSVSPKINPGGAIPGLSEINKALGYARRDGNEQEINWIEHSMNEWYSSGLVILDGELYRKNHYNYDNFQDNNLIKYEHDDILYDLPLPRKAKRRLINIVRLTGYRLGGLNQKFIRGLVSLFNKDKRLSLISNK